MTIFGLSLLMLLLSTATSGQNLCPRLGEGVARPLPYPPKSDPEVLRLVATAQDRVALVCFSKEESGEPKEVRVELFHKGKKKGERVLSLQGRLGTAITAQSSDGTSSMRFALLRAVVSPDGSLLALLSGVKILVFREEEFLGDVEGGFFPNIALTNERLFWSSWAHKKGEPLLMRWDLSNSGQPETVLTQEREGVGKLLLAVRKDGLLWVVDAYTGEPLLVTPEGTVKQRFASLRSLARLPAEQVEKTKRELEKTVPREAYDATRRPPKVDVFPVDSDPWVDEVFAMGNDLLVVSEKEPDKLYWLPDDTRVWQCFELPTLGSDTQTFVFKVTSEEGVWVSKGEKTVFFSATELQDLRRQKEGREETSVDKHTVP